MSLLDDVSIVVTPNGYKAGELYAVVPVPSEGAEEITNGDFATDSAWTLSSGLTFSAGAILFDDDNDNLFQNWTNTVNTLYKLTITKTGSGTLRFRSGYAGSAGVRIDIPESGIIYFTSTSDTNRIQIYGDISDVSATLNSVSVKEYTAADMDVTRATAATRVDEAGLVNYAEIIGSELVNCVNFDCADPAAVWNEGTGWSFSGGKAIYDGTGGTSPIAQSDVIEVGKQYKITIEVLSNEGSGSNTLFLGGTILSTGNLSVGTHTFFGSTNNTSVALTIYGRSGEVFEIGSFSAKEVTRDNVPRIDYTGGGCPHILAEPQRTNLVTYSEDFSQSAWVKSGVTLTSNYSTSPDGTLNATRVTGSSSNSLLQSFVYFSNESQTVIVSFYAKGTGKFRIKNTQGNVVDNYSSNYDATSDWERYSYTITNTSSSSGVQIVGIAGNSTGAAYDLSIWGMQLEIGSYPTSIIPTSGSTVTRNQDQFSRDGISSLINSTEGAFFLEMAALSNDSTNRQLTFSDGTDTNRIVLKYDNQSNVIQSFNRVGGVETAFLAATVSDITQFNKIAVKYKLNDYALWIGGVEVDTDTTSTTFASSVLNELSFGTTSNLFGKVKQLQVYETALTDTQLAALTS